MQKKKVLFFGNYPEKYSRNDILKQGFLENNYEFFHCNVYEVKKNYLYKIFILLRKYLKLKKQFKKEDENFKFDFILVPFPAHSFAWLARILFGKNFYLDFFVSLYDSEIYDRKTVKESSFKAKIYFFYDWYSIRMTKNILTDTKAHLNFYRKFFKIKLEKAKVVYIGCNFKYQNSLDIRALPKVIHFHGTYIPLQGIEYIVKAANILRNENILFRMVGSGQTFKKIKLLITELDLQNKFILIEKVPQEKVIELVNDSDLCLGIFGNSQKASRVIANKVFEYIALKKPFITGDTEGMRELFVSGRDYFGCKVADEINLAEMIKNFLVLDKIYVAKIVENCYDIHIKSLIPKSIVYNLVDEKHLNI